MAAARVAQEVRVEAGRRRTTGERGARAVQAPGAEQRLPRDLERSEISLASLDADAALAPAAGPTSKRSRARRPGRRRRSSAARARRATPRDPAARARRSSRAWRRRCSRARVGPDAGVPPDDQLDREVSPPLDVDLDPVRGGDLHGLAARDRAARAERADAARARSRSPGSPSASSRRSDHARIRSLKSGAIQPKSSLGIRCTVIRITQCGGSSAPRPAPARRRPP